MRAERAVSLGRQWAGLVVLTTPERSVRTARLPLWPTHRGGRASLSMVSGDAGEPGEGASTDSPSPVFSDDKSPTYVRGEQVGLGKNP